MGQATWILRCGRNQRGPDNAEVGARIRENSVLATNHIHRTSRGGPPHHPGTLRRGSSGRARGKNSAEGTHEERKNYVNNPRGNGEAGASTSGKSSDAASVNDRQKLAKLTNGDATIKVSHRAMLAKIKVHQLGSNFEDLPIMQTHMLTKLLAMNACAQIDYSGVGSKADAWHIAHFLKFEKDGVTLRAFKSMKDFQEFIDTIKKCFCAIALEGRYESAFSATSTMRTEKLNWMMTP